MKALPPHHVMDEALTQKRGNDEEGNQHEFIWGQRGKSPMSGGVEAIVRNQEGFMIKIAISRG